MNALVWTVPVALPLGAAALALVVGRRRAWLAVLAPLPALVVALTGPPGPAPDLAWILLDVRLVLDPLGRLLLATTAAVWLAGGLAARGMTGSRPGTAALWHVTLAGNVGLVMAGDVVSLYTLYAVMTFAAYALVVHERTGEARRAGRIYVVMAVAGEASLLSGLMLAVAAAGSTATDEVAAVLVHAPHGGVLVGLILAGFAVKAGVMPVHMWLPLAHPVAPTPASAVLSGAMIKAGLVGWLRLLPLGGAALSGWGRTLIVLGLVSAVVGAAAGIAQTRPKVVLAYSSVSQMGLIATVVGVGLTAPSAAPLAVAAAAVHALHHGLAKAALFLGVGVQRAFAGRGGRWLTLGGCALAAAALAGAPLTSGWVAKALAKDAVELLPHPWSGRLVLLLSIAAVGTTLVMVRLLVLLGRGTAEAASGAPAGGSTGEPEEAKDHGLVVAFTALLAGVGIASWVLPGLLLEGIGPPAVTLSGIVDGMWPVAAGLVVAAGAMSLSRPPSRAVRPIVPPGDLVVPAEAATRALARAASRAVRGLVALRDRVGAGTTALERRLRPGEGFVRLDERLTRWRTVGVSFALVTAALIAMMARAGG